MKNAVVRLSETPSAIPFSLRFSPDGRFLIGTELGTSKINVFEVKQNSSHGDAQLIPVPGAPFDSIGKQPFGFSFNPVNASQIFISNVETLAIPQDVQTRRTLKATRSARTGSQRMAVSLSCMSRPFRKLLVRYKNAGSIRMVPRDVFLGCFLSR